MSSESSLEQLAYDLSLRALQQQETVLDELRSRTGVLLTATALVTSFLGGRALSDGLAWLTAPGLFAALISIILSDYLLAPAAKVTFAVLPVAAYEHFIRSGADLREAQRTLAYWNQDAWERNQLAIKLLLLCFRIACGALVLAVVFWSLNVAVD